MAALTDTDAIINRHMARLLSELEEAGCPVIFRDAVKSKLAWLRSDLNDLKGNLNAEPLPPRIVR
jgi:hypothetical protein